MEKDNVPEDSKNNEESCAPDSNECESSEVCETCERLSAKIKELEDKYVRAYADFENTKKRLEKEKYQGLEYANEAILRDLLPLLDTLDSAVGVFKEDFNDLESALDSIKKGILLTIEKFSAILQKHGVSEIPTDGEFDPNIHNAIMQVKDEGKNDGEISGVLQKGYTYKERVLRPSMVSITKN